MTKEERIERMRTTLIQEVKSSFADGVQDFVRSYEFDLNELKNWVEDVIFQVEGYEKLKPEEVEPRFLKERGGMTFEEYFNS